MIVLQNGGSFLKSNKIPVGRSLSGSFFKCFMLAFFFLLQFSSYAAKAPVECDEVLVLLQVKHIGNIQLPSIICGEEIYLSVTDLFDFLKIRNVPEDDLSSISGYFINREDTFLIDASRLEITYKDKTHSL